MNTFEKMLIAHSNGIKHPYKAWRAAEIHGLPYALMCAVLQKESGGGANIFGHDGGVDGWASGWGKVTKKKYLRYKEGRQAGLGMQGVGPMQLTWWVFQDRADELGGCWIPYINMLVGAEILGDYMRLYDSDIVEVGLKYNGSEAYGKDLAAVTAKWEALLSD